jgi:hypothetical protein
MIEFAAPHAQQARIKNRPEVGLQRAQQSTQRQIATAFGLVMTGKRSLVVSGTTATCQPSSRPMPSRQRCPHKTAPTKLKPAEKSK